LPYLQLPLDRPRVANTRPAWAYSSAGELNEVAAPLVEPQRSALIAGVVALLGRYTQQSEIVLSVIGARSLDQASASPPSAYTISVALKHDESSVRPRGEGSSAPASGLTPLSDDPTFGALTIHAAHALSRAESRSHAPKNGTTSGQTSRSATSSNVALVFAGALPDGALGPTTDAETALALSTPEGYDLCFLLYEQFGRVMVVLAYDRALFDATTIERWKLGFTTLLTSALFDPETRLSVLPVVSSSEARAIEQLCAGSRTDHSDERPDEPMLFRFERLAREQPDALAARHRQQRLTYGELDARATELARYLRAKGVRSEVMVAVCLPSSLDVLVAVLAIFKAGGVYVPLDPTHPRALIAMIIDETKPRLVLTHAAYSTSPLPEGAPLLCLDRDWQLVEQAPSNTVLPPSNVDQSAYVLYTSGTTGKPKGVLASQRNLAHYLKVARQRFGFHKADVFCSLARYTFSISFFELLSPLAAGGSVVLLDRDDVLDPARLAKIIGDITVLHAGPSLLGNLFRHLRATDAGAAKRTFAQMRHASSGGDLVPPHVVEQMKQVFPNAELFVIYGCTEISCMGTQYEVPRGTAVTRSFVGQPFSDVTLRVLDEQGNLVPFGVSGEIFFAGKGVARRYLARPELTAERFVSIDGQRFYRTGDSGRLHADGNLEMLGRRDFQVQLRGIRVELTGIEHTVRDLGLATQCAVIAVARDEQDVRLVAFVVEPRTPNAAAFRKALGAHLPDYMLPQGVLTLEVLPVTANGKLDRLRLRELALQAPLSGDNKQAPRTPMEQAVAGAFASVLGRVDVGVDDDFFDLGGHSLSCVLLMEMLQNKLGVSVSPGLLFEHTTVRALAVELQTGTVAVHRPVLLSQNADRPVLFLLLAVHLYRELARQLEGHYTTYAVYAGSELVLFDKAGGASVQALAREYVAQIKSQQPKGPYRIGGLSFGGIVCYEVAQLLEAQGDQVEYLLMLDAVLPQSGAEKLWRLSKLPRKEIAAELKRRVLKALRRSPADSPPTSKHDVALRTYEDRRQEAYGVAAGEYMHAIRPFSGKTALIVASQRLDAEPMGDPLCGWSKLVPNLIVHNIEAPHLGLLEGEPARELAQAILRDNPAGNVSDPVRAAEGAEPRDKPTVCPAI
jgi:amino acid adenylation domain-containing protein